MKTFGTVFCVMVFLAATTLPRLARAASATAEQTQIRLLDQDLSRENLQDKDRLRLLDQCQSALKEGSSIEELRKVVRFSLQKGGPETAYEAMESYRRMIREGLDDREAGKAVQRMVQAKADSQARERKRDEKRIQDGDTAMGQDLKQEKQQTRNKTKLDPEVERLLREKRMEQERERERTREEQGESIREERRDMQQYGDGNGQDIGEDGDGQGGGDGGTGGNGGRGGTGGKGR